MFYKNDNLMLFENSICVLKYECTKKPMVNH